MSLEKLCLHTITTKPWSFETAAQKYQAAGIKGITIWRDAIADLSGQEVRTLLSEHELELVSYCRGGFFPHLKPEGRATAIEDNQRMLEEAAAIGAPLIVLVCGADPKQSLADSRRQIRDGIEAILPLAESLGVKLAIEPLHPMYAGARSAINTLRQANEMAEAIDSPWLGITVDVYHLWWDPDLEQEIRRCGQQGHLFSYHICDWKVPTTDLLLDRGMMGEGCIPIAEISQWVAQAGFAGYHEVEIFSTEYWAMDQDEYLAKILAAFRKFRFKN